MSTYIYIYKIALQNRYYSFEKKVPQQLKLLAKK